MGKMKLMGKLQLYQSHKLTHAEPMTFLEYVDWQSKQPESLRSSIVDAEAETLEGYHIVYDKGAVGEYHSWCPKDKFELGNKLLGDVPSFNADTSFIGRLQIEHDDLADKLERLLVFLGSEDSGVVTPVGRILLNKQSDLMQEYLNILAIRLQLATK